MILRVSVEFARSDRMSALARRRSDRGIAEVGSGFVVVKKLGNPRDPGLTFGGGNGARLVAADTIHPRRELKSFMPRGPVREWHWNLSINVAYVAISFTNLLIPTNPYEN